MNIKTIKTHLQKHFFSYILVSLIIVSGVVSYYRFMVRNDYLVWYKGTCDPEKEKCFSECADDACTKQSYYSEIQKYAPDLYKECGKDITDCEESNACLPTDRECFITYNNTI